MGRALSGAIPPRSCSSRLRHTHAAPGTWPRAYTSLVSTSSTSASPSGPGATVATRRRAASRPHGAAVGWPDSTAPPACVHASRPPASTTAFGNPMRRSQAAVITDAREAVAGEDDGGRVDGDVLVRRLHRLTARRPDRAGDVRGRVLLARAHVEDVDVLPLAPDEERLELVGRDEGNALVARPRAWRPPRRARGPPATARAASGSRRARARGRPAPSPWSRSSPRRRDWAAPSSAPTRRRGTSGCARRSGRRWS